MPVAAKIPHNPSKMLPKTLRGQKSYLEEKDVSVSLTGVRNILGFIWVGNLQLLNKSWPRVDHLVNTVSAAFTTAFVLGFKLCSDCGHIVSNQFQHYLCLTLGNL